MKSSLEAFLNSKCIIIRYRYNVEKQAIGIVAYGGTIYYVFSTNCVRLSLFIFLVITLFVTTHG